VPKTTAWYWICQAAGWSGFLTYVLVGYYFNASEHKASEVVGIVVLSIVVPILMTHGLRYLMYVRGWAQLKEWRRKVRQFTAAPILALVCTLGVGVAAGVPEGQWVRSVGAWWTFVAYDCAFGGWLWAYERAHAHRSRRELELVAREAQLRALRAQLNPHFLFNSLNSVRSLITENPQQAATMVTGLADILRYSLASDRHDTVPLADEIAIVDEYVGLERTRLEDRLRVERVIDPAALTARVPAMLVQTLVENAVKHGIAPSPRGGLVRLEARVADGRVEITVTNPGRLDSVAGDAGYGLRNARERLRLLYGELASLTLRDDGNQTTAAVTLPMEMPA
jgi:two-component sensor histidine kinase